MGVFPIRGGGVKGIDGGDREFMDSKQGIHNKREDRFERLKEDEDAWTLQNCEKVGGGWVSTSGEGATSPKV